MTIQPGDAAPLTRGFDPLEADIRPAAPPPAAADMARRLDLAGAQGARLTGLDLERIFGSNDLVGVDYLAAGLAAARPVARLIIRGGREGYATGFLVGPQLLLTNRHVFARPEEAEGSLAEFGYELRADGMPARTSVFRLRPELCFAAGDPADDDMDFALVGVEPVSAGGDRLADWGWLRLDERRGKITLGEWITIIQHPSGAHKQVALRENKLKAKGETRPVLEYFSDTAPGSSGSPCFNDQWQVVALHSRGVWRLDDQGRVKLRLGGAIERDKLGSTPGLRDSDIDWECNLGVRTSRIVEALTAENKAQPNPLLDAMLRDVAQGGAAVAMPQAEMALVPVVTEEAARRRRPSRTPARAFGTGYTADFLAGHSIPLPTLTAQAQHFGPAAINRQTGGTELTYTHFSVCQCAGRKLAFYTAVNIDGRASVPLERGRDSWDYDPRLSEDEQAGDWLYQEKQNFFDRGHLVRRLDPCWGDPATVQQANDETFHWTNCSPQHWSFNQGQTLWQGLENYILNNAGEDRLQVSVFNGPIFRPDDLTHRDVQIPRDYWKVVAVCRPDGSLATSGYSVSQARLVETIDFEELPVGRFRTFQRPIAQIGRLTGLDFGPAVLAADVLAQDPAGGHELVRLRDVVG